jgi:hypothetical protein
MSGDAQVLLWIAGVHLLGLGCVAILLIPALRENGPGTTKRQDSDSDEGWGHGPKLPPARPTPPRGGIPLPDAVQSRIRLREAGRLSELLPRRERRPAIEPVPRPTRIPNR